MRIALGIEYDGTGFFGWQRQREVNSVQQELETALTKVANQPIELFCAGRTDAGVHATGQVVHFDTDSDRPLSAWVRGVNAYLPISVRVEWAQPVDEDFLRNEASSCGSKSVQTNQEAHCSLILRAS